MVDGGGGAPAWGAGRSISGGATSAEVCACTVDAICMEAAAETDGRLVPRSVVTEAGRLDMLQSRTKRARWRAPQVLGAE